jgi:hypothetical protein
MTQPILPTDKTIQMGVKLVSMDGIELPFKPFVLIPQDQFVLCEKLVVAARNVAVRHKNYQEEGGTLRATECRTMTPIYGSHRVTRRSYKWWS